MSITDKKYSNVDKKTAEILKEAKLLLDPIGFTVSRVKEKKRSCYSCRVNEWCIW